MFNLTLLVRNWLLVSFLALLGASPTALAQKQHHDVQSLDGQWQIIFDEQNQSRSQKLHTSKGFLAHQSIQTIQVPSVWERIKKDYEGVAVYRKTFNVDKNWKGKIVHVDFDAVNYRAEVYLNDHVVGVHEGGFTPFSFRIDSMLMFDKTNVLTLRVVGPILLDTDKVIDGVGAMETPQWRGGITGGIWQSVRLVASKTAYIDDVFIQTDIQKKQAHIEFAITNFDEYYHQDKLSIEIIDLTSRKTVAKAQLNSKAQPGKNKLTSVIKVPKAKFWSPDTPHLYQLKASLSRNGKLSHAINEQFGFREFTIKDKRFYLNGEETYVKAVFLEGVYPVGIATPIDLEMARKEIRLAKEAGFNMIRPWRRPPQPEWLDLADEMGVMVIGSPVLECMDLPVSTPDLPRRVNFEIEQTIKRDRNRPSIVMWELFNELRRPVLKQMMAETAMLARDTDPSRLILDESGGWAFGAKVYLPNSREFLNFNDVHTYPGPNVTNHWYDKFLAVGYTKQQREALNIKASPIGHNVKPGLTSFVSELGYGSYVDFTEVNKTFEQQGNPIAPPMRYHKQLGSQLETVLKGQLSEVYQSPAAFYQEQQHIHGLANARMIEATRANPNVTGYCVHALTGGDWIMGAGLLDLWRNPKQEVFDRTKAANQPRILSVRTFPRNAYQGQNIRFNVTGINDLTALNGQLDIKVVDSNGSAVWQKSRPITLPKRVALLAEHQLNSNNLSGEYQVIATLTKGKQTIAQNSYKFDVFNKGNEVAAPFAVADQTGRLKAYLDSSQINYQAFNPQLSTDVLVVAALEQRIQNPALSQQLSEFSKQGGTVLYLQFPYIRPKWKSGVLSKGYSKNMPVNVKIKASSGLWGGMSHIALNNPVFNGLPNNEAMHGVYENVRAKFSMVNVNGSSLVPVVANDNFPDMTLMKRHYQGTGDVWTGTDLTEIKLGEGTVVLNTMELLPHLGKDPAADIIFSNLIKHLQKNSLSEVTNKHTGKAKVL